MQPTKQQVLQRKRAESRNRSGPMFELTEFDLQDKAIRDKARIAAVELMRSFLKDNPNRLLKTLTAPELDGILQAGLTEFVKARAAMLKQLPSDPLDDLFM